MASFTTILLLLVLLNVSQAQECPTGLIRDEEQKCVCGRYNYYNRERQLLSCDCLSKNVTIIAGVCMTYNNGTQYFGYCPYNTHGLSFSSKCNFVLPVNVSMLNSVMCGLLIHTSYSH